MRELQTADVLPALPVRDRIKNKFFFIGNTGVIGFAIGSLANVTSPQI